MAKILGVGIATLDIINYVEEYPKEDSEVRALSQKIARGGNATNTLTVLSQLKHETFWTGTLAEEADANRILMDLNEYNINTKFIKIQPTGKVPTSYILLNTNSGTRSIVHYRDLQELDFEHFQNIPHEEFDWIHFEARNINETVKMLEYLSNKHSQIPVSIEFEKHRPGIEQLLKYGDVQIFSKNYCLQSDNDKPEEFLVSLYRHYKIKTLILAWGDQGAYGYTPDTGLLFSSALKVENIKDTLGAGDTFNAGIIDAIISGHSVSSALEKANKLAAYKISVSGFDISAYEH